MVLKSIGSRLKEYRKFNKLTQEQVAEAANVTTNYIYSVESGRNSVNLNILVNMINCIGCSADDIFQDVVVMSHQAKGPQLFEEISKLSVEEQERIYAILETLIKTANRK